MQNDQTRPRVVAIIQARMSSARLPGKVLLPLADQPTLWHVAERLKRISRLNALVIATTCDRSDDAIADLGRTHGLTVFRYDGAAGDLLGRYIACGRAYGADIVVTADGNCPLIHPPTATQLISALLHDPQAECAQLDERSLEAGMAVLRLSVLERIAAEDPDAQHREHATQTLLENPEQFHVVEVKADQGLLDIRRGLSLNTPADHAFLQAVYGRLYRADEIVDLHAVLRLLREDEAVHPLNAHGIEGLGVCRDVMGGPRRLARREAAE